MNIQAALKTQYHASLAMLKQAIEDCPDELWEDAVHPSYWRIVYHTLFYTHLYLMPHVDDFQLWEKHREHVPDFGPESWPPGVEPPPSYSPAELMEYWDFCDRQLDAWVDQLDLSAPLSGFHWYDPLPKLDHQINNIRHIQHHTAVLSDRLRAVSGRGVGWRGMVK